MNSIKGKFALVTGGTQGLGAAIAKNFAENGAEGIVTIGRKEEKGDKVAKQIQDETGCKVIFIKTDLSDVKQCRNAVAVALRGRVPCKVVGVVRKGDVLIQSSTEGHAKAAPFRGYQAPAACIIGKSLETKSTPDAGVVEVLV